MHCKGYILCILHRGMDDSHKPILGKNHFKDDSYTIAVKISSLILDWVWQFLPLHFAFIQNMLLSPSTPKYRVSFSFVLCMGLVNYQELYKQVLLVSMSFDQCVSLNQSSVSCTSPVEHIIHLGCNNMITHHGCKEVSHTFIRKSITFLVFKPSVGNKTLV